MKYACIGYRENVTGLANGYYIDNIIEWDGNTTTYTPQGYYHVQLPTEDDCTLTSEGRGLYAIINEQLTSIQHPAIGDKYDPNTGAFTRSGSDQVIWSPWDVDNFLPQLKSYRCIEYKEFPNQSLKTGYYATQLVYHKASDTPSWESSDNKFYIGYSNNWSYTEDKDGVATTVTLPDIDVKIPGNDTWILPLITS